MKYSQFHELPHRFIINCVVFLDCDTQSEHDRSNDVDNNDDKGSENDRRLLGTIVEKPVFAIQGVIWCLFLQGLIIFLELREFNIAHFSTIFHKVAKAETVHETEPLFSRQLLIGPCFTFKQIISRF